MEKNKSTKLYSDCYLYNKYPEYNNIIFAGIMSEKFIDKGVDSFQDIVYEVKRTKVNYGLTRVVASKNTVLILPDKPMPKPFKVFCAKDIRDHKKLKVFIDCSGIIKDIGNGYSVNDDILISYLVNASTCMHYAVMGTSFLTGTAINNITNCFAMLFTHIIDYVGKISIVDNAKDKCIYLSSRYFLQGICLMEEKRSREIARKLSGITEMKENTYDIIASRTSQDVFTELRNFVKLLSVQFKLDKLTTNIIVEKWMYLYGPGTVFSLEFLPAFCAMLTDAYCGAYINNQKTIEKICGKSMVAASKSIIEVAG